LHVKSGSIYKHIQTSFQHLTTHGEIFWSYENERTIKWPWYGDCELTMSRANITPPTKIEKRMIRLNA
jgi:hypothetical protein